VLSLNVTRFEDSENIQASIYFSLIYVVSSAQQALDAKATSNQSGDRSMLSDSN